MIDRNFLQSLEKLVKPLRSRLYNIVQRGVIHQIDPSGQMQVSFAEGDTQEGIRKCEHFGFTSEPPRGSGCFVLFPGGVRGIGFSMATHGIDVPKVELKESESAHYNGDGSYIALRQGGKFEMKNKDAELISVLCDLLGKIEEMSKYLVLSAQDSYGKPCTMITPTIDLSPIKKSLESFKK